MTLLRQQQISQTGMINTGFAHPVTTRLTSRECSVACLAINGLPAKKIASQLGISEKTVRNQLTIIYEKLQVVNQVELCLKAPQFDFCRLNNTPYDRDNCPYLASKPRLDPG